MSQTTKTFRTIPQTTLRRLRNTPSYFFVLWRWAAWLYALITIVSSPVHPNPTLTSLLLLVTLLQTLVVTLYAPIFQIFLPGLPGFRRLRQAGQRRPPKQRRIWRRRGQRPLAADEDADILTPLTRTANPYWDIAIYGIDVIICGMVTYYGGYFGNPPFGDGSPFYRYGLSTALVAALSYRYRGGLAAALGYEFFILLGAFFPPPGTLHYTLNAQDLAGSLIDAPLVAILAAYLSSLLGSYLRSKRREQDNVRNQQALLSVSETLMQGASDRQSLLQRSAEQIRRGGHFERLVVALLGHQGEKEVAEASPASVVETYIDTYIEAGVTDAASPDASRALLKQVVQAHEQLSTFTPLDGEKDADNSQRYGIARLYLPIFKEGQLYIVLGAEGIRQTSFESKQEKFLKIVGAQLVVALENMRLTEQTIELAAAAERGRIAREIHDGVAQLVYILSLNSETCAALAHRIAEASEDDDELLTPLAERLDKLVTISKQALWETRNYMFTLKPLISGSSTLTQMLANQLREFEAISGLPVRLEVEGTELIGNRDQNSTRKTAQVGTAIFRITQEALTNAYKHAQATELHVHLRYQQHSVEVEVCDNGIGMETANYSYDLSNDGERKRILSGHGMHGMRERAEELGGTLQLKQIPTGGVSVHASIPI